LKEHTLTLDWLCFSGGSAVLPRPGSQFSLCQEAQTPRRALVCSGLPESSSLPTADAGSGPGYRTGTEPRPHPRCRGYSLKTTVALLAAVWVFVPPGTRLQKKRQRHNNAHSHTKILIEKTFHCFSILCGGHSGNAIYEDFLCVMLLFATQFLPRVVTDLLTPVSGLSPLRGAFS
jgi:hypothetical protein